MTWKPGPENVTALGEVDAVLYPEWEKALAAYKRNPEEDEAEDGPETLAWLELAQIGWDPKTREWAFLFHGACWEIFTTRFGDADGTGEKALAVGLARILSDLNQDVIYPRSLVPVCFMNGKPKAWQTYNRAEPRRLEDTSEIYSEASLNRDELDKTPSELISRSRDSSITTSTQRQIVAKMKVITRPHRSRRSKRPRVQDFFSRLPRELLLCILPYVAFADLPNLRLASKCIAAVSTLEQLPSSYWKTHFLRDYPCAIPWELSPQTDFRKLCFAMAPLFQQPCWDIPGYLRRNMATERLIVWNGLDDVRNLLCRTPLGIPVDSLTD